MQDAFVLCMLSGEQLQPIDLLHGEVQHKEHCHHRQHTVEELAEKAGISIATITKVVST